MTALDSREGARSGRDVVVNGESRRVSSTSFTELVGELGFDPEGRGIAIACDGEVVPRGAWSTTEIPAGARIEIVGAVQGG